MSKKNFRIIENSPPKYLEKYDEFIKLYYDPDIQKKHILKKLDWSDNQYKQARAKAVKEGKIAPVDKTPKYYYHNKQTNKYIVSKRNKKIKLECSVNTEEEAKALVDFLNKHGWTKQNITRFTKIKR